MLICHKPTRKPHCHLLHFPEDWRTVHFPGTLGDDVIAAALKKIVLELHSPACPFYYTCEYNTEKRKIILCKGWGSGCLADGHSLVTFETSIVTLLHARQSKEDSKKWTRHYSAAKAYWNVQGNPIFSQFFLPHSTCFFKKVKPHNPYIHREKNINSAMNYRQSAYYQKRWMKT